MTRCLSALLFEGIMEPNCQIRTQNTELLLLRSIHCIENDDDWRLQSAFVFVRLSDFDSAGLAVMRRLTSIGTRVQYNIRLQTRKYKF